MGSDHSRAAEGTSMRGGGDRRHTMIGRSAKLRIGAGRLFVMYLIADGRQVPFVGLGAFGLCGLRGDAAMAAIETHAVDRDVVDHCAVVDVADMDVVRNIVDTAVIEERPAAPFA